MKSLLIAIASVTLVTTLAGAAGDAGQDAERQLKTAMNTELVDGNLKLAIEQYKKVAESGNRALAAQALLQMAGCHQKLGDAEARNIYERLIRDFADQSDVVLTARGRLGASETKRATALTLRKMWSVSDVTQPGTVSQDGRYLSYPDPTTGDLMIHDFVTGGDRRLTDKGSALSEANASVISRDGKRVAYAWRGCGDPCWIELRTIALDTTGIPPARTLFKNDDVVYIVPGDWSPDGRWIGVRTFHRDRATSQIALVSVEDGSLRVLKSLGMGSGMGYGGMSFSPDGRFLAYDVPSGITSEPRDTFVMAVDGSREVAAVRSGSLMGWSRDGKQLLFASYRSGTPGLWAIAFANGNTRGTPELIKSDTPSIRLDSPGISLGTTARGDLFFWATGGDRDIHTSAVDFTTGSLLDAASTVATSFVGSNSQPDWSPDGAAIAFKSVRALGKEVLAIRSLASGSIRELTIGLAHFNWPRWSPDGRSFVAHGTDLQGRQGIHLIDAVTGAVTSVAFAAGPLLHLQSPVWSPDGRRVYYRKGFGTLAEKDLASGSERDVIQREQLYRPSISPDGRYLATTTFDPHPPNPVMSVLLIPVDGGQPRELLRGRRFSDWVTWLPGGREVLVYRSLSDRGDGELLVVPIDGGQPRALRHRPQTADLVAVRPDGRHLAFIAGDAKKEVWVLENFLPAPVTAKPSAQK